MIHSFLYEDTVDRGWRPSAAPCSPAHHTRRRSAGQAMVEMALVIGVVLLVILGGIDLLQIAMTQYTVSQAVRASAHSSSRPDALSAR